MSIESRSRQYGKVFGHWQIRTFLGEGSSGKTAVFRLVHTSSQTIESAMKVISLMEVRGNPADLSDRMRSDYQQACERARASAEQEVLMMHALRGRTNIVDYLDHTIVEWEENGRFGCDMLIRMELLQDLRSQIKPRQTVGFREPEVLKIGKDICGALILCHGKHILHRDIKPENIFFNEDGNYKLGDFGISRILSELPLSQATTSVGTPPYLAPEQLSGRYDSRVDIYSLGLVLYELSNRCLLPFAASPYITESEIILRLKGTPLPAPSNASPALAQVILKACAPNPDHRYQTAQEFLEALEAVEASSGGADQAYAVCSHCGTPLDPRTQICPNLKCPSRKRKFLCILLAAALFAAAAVLAGPWLPGKRSASVQPQEAPAAVSVPQTAAACVHSWQPATCTAPESCLLCGETGAAPLAHSWKGATYSAPKTCLLCGETRGEPLGSIGDLITFGRYEQDNNVANGPEPIMWEILDIDGDNIFVISQYALDCQRYHAKMVTTTWATSSLRQWLNGTFLNAAFSEAERQQIITTHVPADPNSWYQNPPGSDTQDQIFILSLSQVKQYLPHSEDRLHAATPYAANQGAYVNATTGGSWWWVRTPGETLKMAVTINSDGQIDYEGGAVATPPGTVLPVMWLHMVEAE